MSENIPNNYTLINPCRYSFEDLIKASETEISLQKLYAMSQEERNNRVKEMCKLAKWYYTDVEKEGMVYTAFSPERKKVP